MQEVRALVGGLVGDWFTEFSRLLAKPLGTQASDALSVGEGGGERLPWAGRGVE